MTRKLSEKEIENILAFIKPQPDIPIETAMSVVKAHKKRFRKQLVHQEVYPEIIPELKKTLEKVYRNSLIQPGESVGVICAQSIGQKNTQTTLNTFHKAGQSEKTMTAGVPRFEELLNATKNPRIVNQKIYFKGANNTIQELRETVGYSIAGLTFQDISESMVVEMDKKDEPWYDAYKILYSDEFAKYNHCISIKLNMNKMFGFKLSMQDLANYLFEEYGDLYCVCSPPEFAQLDIFVDTENIELPDDRVLFVDQENAVDIYLEECVLASLEKMYIGGIPSITEVFYIKEGDKWIVETNGFNSRLISKKYSSFKKLLANPCVDQTRTISSNVWDIYETLGVEAAREFLIEEFISIMEGINSCHAKLLVDRMTHGGGVASITRYTMKKEESGPMGKASFEETMDNFLNAAAQGEIEPTNGVSASIMCGKRSSIGTGMIKIGIDIKRLPGAAALIGDVREKAKERAIRRSRSRKKSFAKKLVSVPEHDDDDCIPEFIEI